MSRYALMLGLLLASGPGAEELTPRTRALLHEALETRLALPTDPPSLQRPTLQPGLPASAQFPPIAIERMIAKDKPHVCGGSGFLDSRIS